MSGPSPPEPRRGLAAPFAHRSFRLLWTGAFVSSAGTWLQDVALAWVIHSRIGEPFYLGLRTFAAEGPLIAFMVVGGAVADRVDRRVILLASQVVQMSLAATLGWLYATDRLDILSILLIAFVTGLAQSQSAPTYQATLTSLVPTALIPSAVALNSLQFNLSRVVGPALAGVLLARGQVTACFALNAASFLAIIVSIARIELPPPESGARPETLRASLAQGFRHVRESPTLAILMALAGLGSFLSVPLITYLPVVAGETLRAGAAGYSALLSSYGAGAIVGAIATAQRGRVPNRGRIMAVGLVAYATAAALAMASRHLRLSMVLFFLAGASMVTAFSTLNSLVQEEAPAALKGRVLAIYGLAFRGGSPLGSLLAGVLVGRFGAPAVLAVFSTLLGLVAIGAFAGSTRVRAL